MVTKATDLLKPVSANNKRLQKSNGELQAVRVQLEKDIRELEAAMVREAMAQEAMVHRKRRNGSHCTLKPKSGSRLRSKRRWQSCRSGMISQPSWSS